MSDVQSICRMCFNHFEVDEETVDFDDYYFDEYRRMDGITFIKWVDVYETFTNLRVFHDNDGSPRKLCNTCSSQLSTLMTLRSKADHNEQMLKGIFATPNEDTTKRSVLLSPVSLPDQVEVYEPETANRIENAKPEDTSLALQTFDSISNETIVFDDNWEIFTDVNINRFVTIQIGSSGNSEQLEPIEESQRESPLVEAPESLEPYLEAGLPAVEEIPGKMKDEKKLSVKRYLYRTEVVSCETCGKSLKRTSLRKHVLRFHTPPVNEDKSIAKESITTNESPLQNNDSDDDNDNDIEMTEIA